MVISRREAVTSFLFGAGLIGLRALATGLPAAFLLNPKKALAQGMPTCANQAAAQYFILNTSFSGDPINANVPGTYGTTGAAATIYHSPMFPATNLTLGGTQYQAAPPWAGLPQSVLDQTCFWHLATNTPVHPREPDVLKLMGSTTPNEMLPSLLSRQLQPCLNTIQAQPVTVGAQGPVEGLSYEGAALPIIPPTALKATLSNAAGPLTSLQPLRDQTLNSLYDLYRNDASPSQKSYIDSLVTSTQQVRSINQNLLNSLATIKDNSVPSQITAAIALIQMNVTPVVAINIPFGRDNHFDTGLATEVAETTSGVGYIGSLMQQLQSAGLQQQVTFMTLNVFGRTINMSNQNGRQHNPNHQVSVTISSRIKPGVIGAVATVGSDIGATDIDSKTGQGTQGADIPAAQTLASYGKTMLAAVGVDSGTIDNVVGNGGQVISAALV